MSGLQEDPYKLVLLAKDTKQVCVTNADFFFTNGELSFVTGDEEGIIRIYEYNPQGKFDSACFYYTDEVD
jgi:cleavage and polyadenylation specificity factor subunit 1